jgi:hypothetical protein
VPNLDRAAAWANENPSHRLPLFAAAAAVHAVIAPTEAFGIEGGAIVRNLAGRERIRVKRVSERLGIGAATLSQLLALGLLSDGLTVSNIHALTKQGVGEGISSGDLVQKVIDTPWWKSGRLVRLQPDRMAAAFLGMELFDPKLPEGDERLPDWMSTALMGNEAGFGDKLGRILFDLDAPDIAPGAARSFEMRLTAIVGRQ